MKKFIKIFLLAIAVLVVLLIALIYGLLFTQTGNNILKPIIEKKAKEASGIDIKLDKFSLRLSSIDVEAVVMDSIKAKAAGGLNIFNQSFDINYSIHADRVPEVSGIKIDEPLSLNGQAAGGLKDININGTGDIFGAALNFDAVLKDFNPVGINIDTNGLKLAKVFALLGQPVYADGTLLAKVHINPNEKNELGGDAILHINKGAIYKNVLKKEFNITLKEDISYETSADLKLSNSQDLVGMLDIVSSLANFKATDLKVNINTFETSSAYKLDIPNLKQLEGLIGIALQGAVSFYGDVKYAANSVQANVNSDDFAGGKLALKLNNDKLNADLTNVKVSKILHTLVMPSYTDANLDVKAEFSSLVDKTGVIDIDLTNGIANSAVLKKEFNLTLKNNAAYKISADLKLSNGKDLTGKADLTSSLANFKATDLKVNINTFETSSAYKLDIPNLKQLEGLAGIALQGAVSFYGDAKYAANNVQANVNSDNLAGGKLALKLDNDKLDASLINVKIAEVLTTLVKPSYADANLNIKAQFNSLSNKNGVINIDLTDGLVNSAVVKKEFNLTLPKTDFNAKSNITLKKNTADFNAKFLSSLASLEKFEGVFDINKTELKSTYTAIIKDLSKFDGITKQKMKGSIALDGEASYKNGAPKVNGKSSVLGGNVKFDFENNRANISGVDISTLELLGMLSYPQIFDAKIKFDANYNINTSKGSFNAASPDGHMTQTQLGDLVNTLSGYDITKEKYENSSIKGTIEGEKIRFAFDTKSKKTALRVTDGKISGTALDIPFSIQIEKTDVAGRVTGTSDKPKVSIDSSKYLKDKAVKEIDKYLEKNSDKIEKALNKLFK
ncbi:MAG: AsmA family protein [Campylobacteraceae bacterium]|jgi:predicted secreted protein|nr:AsmA family protein [Campylobacteraceae bacterium]